LRRDGLADDDSEAHHNAVWQTNHRKQSEDSLVNGIGFRQRAAPWEFSSSKSVLATSSFNSMRSVSGKVRGA